jgi:hypothetical protein
LVSDDGRSQRIDVPIASMQSAGCYPSQMLHMGVRGADAVNGLVC